MNHYEREMVNILKRGADLYGMIGAKAEFEAEGTRVDELLRLLDIVNKANVKIALKIGGCEAKRDLLEAKQYGVNYIIAPMIESEYALKKYINVKNKVFNSVDNDNIQFLFNLETISSYKNLDQIIQIASSKEGCNGLVFGRVDFLGSMELERKDIDSEEISIYGEKIAYACKKNNLDFVIGGGISLNSLNFLKKLNNIKLDRFETRKIIFNNKPLDNNLFEDALKDAVQFELYWLLNKKDHYEYIYKEDEKRILMLEERLKSVINA